jgi:glutamyl-tRNA synthetase
MYLSYAVKLLKEGRAYPCFASKEQLEENVKKQQAAKVRPGYYGQWALWRDKSDVDIEAALQARLPFVLRFRSLGNHEKRVAVEDVLKGHVELPENDLDVPLIKADGSQLPTYHLAHVVDDHLMKSTIILRGDEWLPSTPLHIELAQALGVQPFSYAHFAPISVLDKNGGGKRKLSKRKDPEADVNFWLSAGYPIDGIKAYLLGLANSTFEEWYTANPTSPLSDFMVTLEKLAASRAPLLDHNKLEDYCKDYFAKLPQEEFTTQIIAWAKAHDPGFYQELVKDAAYTNAVLSIERGGDKPRKDLAKLSDASDQYLYFFDFSYDLLKLWDDTVEGYPFADKTIEDIAQAKAAFLQTYNHAALKDEWFENMKKAAEAAGYALDNQAYKASPESFKGKIADFAQIIRYAVTLGKTRTPDLYAIMQIMGEDRVRRRLS